MDPNGSQLCPLFAISLEWGLHLIIWCFVSRAALHLEAKPPTIFSFLLWPRAPQPQPAAHQMAARWSQKCGIRVDKRHFAW